ncbi:hypothetical protein BH09ACT5_BH09ACT5_19250 [soil metagenome]
MPTLLFATLGAACGFSLLCGVTRLTLALS